MPTLPPAHPPTHPPTRLLEPLTPAVPTTSLAQVIYDTVADELVSVGPCPGVHPSGGGAARPLCSAKSSDEGSTWSTFLAAGHGNGTVGGNEGSGGVYVLFWQCFPFSSTASSWMCMGTRSRVLPSPVRA